VPTSATLAETVVLFMVCVSMVLPS